MALENKEQRPGEEWLNKTVGPNNRYLVCSYIDSGGFGAVFKAKDLVLSNDEREEFVALKLFSNFGPNIQDQAKSDELIKNFKHEANAYSKLLFSDNVVKIKDFFADGKQTGIIMELVDSPKKINGIFSGYSFITKKEFIYYFKQILIGLDSVHAQNIIHRDIKPGNVLVNDKKKVKIIDVGIAKFKGQAGEQALGTPRFMAPEQYRESKNNGEPIDYNADIYSLGVIMYHIATGIEPYTLYDASLDDKQNQKRKEEELSLQPFKNILIKPKRLNPNIDLQWEYIILKCMAKDKKKRYQNCTEVLQDIEKLEKNEEFKLDQFKVEFDSKHLTEFKEKSRFKFKKFISQFKWFYTIPFFGLAIILIITFLILLVL